VHSTVSAWTQNSPKRLLPRNMLAEPLDPETLIA
jgi:hypothetical protein